ncbi:MAG: hypothetical protein JWN44_3695 [Myxococcales bacterium]|nr:hypothetical protein [Myxococcales bacterium]
MFPRVLAVAALSTFTACSPKNPPLAPSTPTHPSTSSADLPKSPDIANEVMGWMVVADGARLAQQLSPDVEGSDPKTAQIALLAQLGVTPDLAAIIDLKRPLGLALLNPALLATGSTQPYVAMVPVQSRKAVEDIMAAHNTPMERTAWGFSTPTGPKARMHVAFVGGYAVVAWRADLLEATVKLLAPRLAKKADAPVVVHLDFSNVHDAFGPQIEAMLGQMAKMAGQGGETGDPQVAFALRGVRQIAQYMRSVSDLELLADIDSGGLTLTLRADGEADGAFNSYVKQQRPGPAWGVQFLPRDSVLAFATHESPVGRAADITASVAYVGEMGVRAPANQGEREKVRRAFERAALTTNGELAYAVWPGRAGGVGLGGAYRISNAVEARAAVADVYQTVSTRLGPMVMKALLMDSEKLLQHVHVQKRTVHFGDVEADLVEVSVAWPKGMQAERHMFESLFGKKLVMATAFLDQQALFTIGADYQERLSAMIGTARGMPAASLNEEPAFVEALQYKEGSRVSLSYLETAGMARFAAGLVQQGGDMGLDEEKAVARLLTSVGRGAIVSTTNASGRRFEVTTHVPHTAIVGVAALNGALWRMALSPLVNPPMMPPMPVPPPHVTPSVNHATEGTL